MMKALKLQQWKCTDEVGYWVVAALRSAADDGNHHSQWMGIIAHWSTNRWCYSSGIQVLELAYHSRYTVFEISLSAETRAWRSNAL